MKTSAFLIICFFVLALSSLCAAQDPLPVIKSSWRLFTQKGEKVELPTSGPAKALTPDDQYFVRNARALRTDHPQDPSETTPDGRRAELDKIAQQARTPQPTNINGFDYSATVRNESQKTVKVIYWEYKFVERANPQNVVRRQFLCSVNIKKGAEFDLKAFSTLGPTGVVSASTETQKDKQFDETVRVNRIEYADDDILQRGDWKFSQVKSAVDRVTAAPWGKEICRPLLP